MNNLWRLARTIKINPLFWLVLGIGVVTGYFREVLMVFLIVFIHELGHAGAAHYFKWRIHKVELLPFGGVAEVEDSGNKPFREELLVIIAGPFQHFWMIGLSYLCVGLPFWSAFDHQAFVWHNLTILLFNLLPISPLDGGRLLQLWCAYYLPFQKAIRVSWTLSVIILILFAGFSLFFLPFHLNLWVVLGFLMVANYFEWRQRHYRFVRFLMTRQAEAQRGELERTSLRVQEKMLVRDAVKLFKRGRIHRLIVGHAHGGYSFIDEKILLRALFHENKLQSPLNELT